MLKNMGCFLDGCLMWLFGPIGVVLVVLFLLFSALTGPSRDDAEAKKALAKAETAKATAAWVQAQADKAQADALVIRAEGDAQAVVIQAESQAKSLEMYTKAGVNAIETDRKQAHPKIWMAEMIKDFLPWFVLLGWITFIVVLVLWYLRTKPKSEIVLESQKDIKPAPSQVSIVSDDDVTLGPKIESKIQNGYEDVTGGENTDA